MGPTKEPFKAQHKQRITEQVILFRKASRKYDRSIKQQGIDPHCPQCGADIYELGQNFCPYCRLDMRAMKTTCKSCGHSNHSWAIPEGHKTCCPMCGVPWDHENTILPSLCISSFSEGRA